MRGLAMDDEHPLRLWRVREKRTLKDVAGCVGIMPSHLSYIERRHRRPGIRIVHAMMKLTGLPIEAFLHEKDAKA